MAGRGSPTSRGDGRPITTAAGSCMAGTGLGGRARCITTPTITLCGRLRTCRSSVGAEAAGVLDSASEVASERSVGCRADRATGITPGGAAGGVTTGSSTGIISVAITTDSVRCGATAVDFPTSTRHFETSACAPDSRRWTVAISAANVFRRIRSGSARHNSINRGWSADACPSNRHEGVTVRRAEVPIRGRFIPRPQRRNISLPAAIAQTPAASIAAAGSRDLIAGTGRLHRGKVREAFAIPAVR